MVTYSDLQTIRMKSVVLVYSVSMFETDHFAWYYTFWSILVIYAYLFHPSTAFTPTYQMPLTPSSVRYEDMFNEGTIHTNFSKSKDITIWKIDLKMEQSGWNCQRYAHSVGVTNWRHCACSVCAQYMGMMSLLPSQHRWMLSLLLCNTHGHILTFTLNCTDSFWRYSTLLNVTTFQHSPVWTFDGRLSFHSEGFVKHCWSLWTQQTRENTKK